MILLFFFFFLFLSTLWNGLRKDQRNNTSIKSGLNMVKGWSRANYDNIVIMIYCDITKKYDITQWHHDSINKMVILIHCDVMNVCDVTIEYHGNTRWLYKSIVPHSVCNVVSQRSCSLCKSRKFNLLDISKNIS